MFIYDIQGMKIAQVLAIIMEFLEGLSTIAATPEVQIFQISSMAIPTFT